MLDPQLIKELQEEMSLTRLASVGLFQKMGTDDGPEIAREIRLHRAVLDKALVDMFSPRKRIKRDVEVWLDITNPDFREASERAALEPELVYKVFKSMKEILQGEKAKFKKCGPRKKNTNEGI